jgi:hypothetical protein
MGIVDDSKRKGGQLRTMIILYMTLQLVPSTAVKVSLKGIFPNYLNWRIETKKYNVSHQVI